MTKCVNKNCNKDPFDNPNWVAWGCDFDACCDEHCYNEARKQMNNFCENILPDDKKLAEYLGVPIEWIPPSIK